MGSGGGVEVLCEWCDNEKIGGCGNFVWITER